MTNPRRPNRLTVELSDDTMQTIHDLADLDGISMAEVVRRAVRAGQFFVHARIADERVLLQSRKTGTVREVMIW